MSLDPQLLALMPHTVTLTAPTGRNGQGQPTYVGGTAKSYRARIVGMTMALRFREHSDTTRLFDVYVAIGSDPVTSQYKLGLPSDTALEDGSGADPLIFTVTRETDETGHHHVKLSCGFMYHRQGG